MVSALTGIPARAAVAMTGEITLRGEVLPIGGLKEKLLAAHRGGIKTVLIPEDNVKDLTEIPENIKIDWYPPVNESTGAGMAWAQRTTSPPRPYLPCPYSRRGLSTLYQALACFPLRQHWCESNLTAILSFYISF